jgi:putative hydrolase of the HAD superfamily
MTHSTHLLFDLGGVIVPWVGVETLMDLTGLTRDDVTARMVGSDIFNAYEIGACDDATFCAEMVSLFDLDMAPADFPALWNSWVHAPFPGTLAALETLKATYTIACLSNTNALHWAHLQSLIDPYDSFHHAFASQLIQAAKPNPQSYRIPLSIMGVSAESVHFFDDTLVNVEAARAVGMQATHVDRKVGVLPTLRQLGLLRD